MTVFKFIRIPWRYHNTLFSSSQTSMTHTPIIFGEPGDTAETIASSDFTIPDQETTP